jgi:hypothetical protein
MKKPITLFLFLVFTVSTSAYYWKTTVSNNYILVSQDGVVDIYDATQLPEHNLICSYSLDSTARSAASQGNYVFIAAGSLGIIVLDISNTASPVPRDTLNIGDDALDIAIRNNYALVAAGMAGLAVVDISNPESLVLDTVMNTSGEAEALAIEGTMLYLASGGIYAVDISNPSQPIQLDIFPQPTQFSGFSGVGAAGDYVYGASGHQGLKIIDASNPQDLQQVGEYNVGGSMVAGVTSVAVSGNLAFVAYYEKGLHVLDISNPAAPKLLMERIFDSNTHEVAIAGDYLLITDLVTGLTSFKIEDLVSSSDYEQDLQAVKAILEANGIIVDDVSPYISDADGRVVSLQLAGLGLTTIPADIGQLTGLRELDLSDNSISMIDTAIIKIPVSVFVDTVVYGCQVYFDGSCVSWGDVLATVKVDIKADFSLNQLCDVDSSVADWLNRADSAWEQSQFMNSEHTISCEGITVTPQAGNNNESLKVVFYPCSRFITIWLNHMHEDIEAVLSDLTGSTVAEIKSARSDNLQLDAGGLPAGIYLLTVQTRGRKYMQILNLLL